MHFNPYLNLVGTFRGKADSVEQQISKRDKREEIKQCCPDNDGVCMVPRFTDMQLAHEISLPQKPQSDMLLAHESESFFKRGASI